MSRRPDRGLGNIRSSPGDPSRNIDWVLLIAQGALTVAGCFIVFSASWTTVEGDPYAFVTRQVLFAIVGYVVMFAIMAFDYDYFRQRAVVLYAASIAMLVLLLLLGIAQQQDRISFDFGPINLQPAELAKVTTLLMVCAAIVDDRATPSDEVSYAKFLGGLIIVAVPAVLVIAQPDLGSASVIITIAMGVMLVAGARAKYIAMISVLSISTVAATFVGGLVNEYQKERLRVFLGQEQSEDSVYQVRNAIRALGTGELWGKGWLQGDLTNNRYVPVMWADFPFAAVGEQFGLVGCLSLLALFVIVLMRIFRIATLSRDPLGTYLCSG
ncbi:MAG: FtsW/RodA/SpoVE family cell cycle protein, partial [Ilumatobacteraceae bacterium]